MFLEQTEIYTTGTSRRTVILKRNFQELPYILDEIGQRISIKSMLEIILRKSSTSKFMSCLTLIDGTIINISYYSYNEESHLLTSF